LESPIPQSVSIGCVDGGVNEEGIDEGVIEEEKEEVVSIVSASMPGPTPLSASLMMKSVVDGGAWWCL
jgi:hypothetical protein